MIYLLPRGSREFWRRSYLGDDPSSKLRDWRIAPLKAPSLEGLPPTTVITASLDYLYPSNLRLIDALRAAGVAVEHIHEDKAPHGFVSLPVGYARVAERVLDTRRTPPTSWAICIELRYMNHHETLRVARSSYTGPSPAARRAARRASSRSGLRARAAVAAVAAADGVARRLEDPAGGARFRRRDAPPTRRRRREAAANDEVDGRRARVTRSVAWRWSPPARRRRRR